MQMLQPGDRAPDLQLPDQDGRSVRLSDLIAKGPVVVYFYPKDDTPVCTKEACTFRDAQEDFVGLEASIVGISDDDPGSHKRFAEKHGLPYTLLSDEKGEARSAFGLRSFLGLKDRATFVIGQDGRVRSVIRDRLNARKHVREALAALRDQGLTRS